MNRTTTAKIGFFTLFAMFVGSVIGIGIFLKNGSVFKSSEFNPTSILLAWIISTLICLVTALSYAEIGLSSFSRLGLGRWSEKYGGKGLGYFVKFNLPIFYYGLLLPGISYYSAEMLLLNFTAVNGGILKDGLGQYSTVSLVVFLGTALYLIFLILNYISLKLSGHFQKFSLVVKFIPLIAVVIFGVVFGAISPKSSLFFIENNPSANPNIAIKPFNFNAVIIGLPGILFAFDSFLNFGPLVPSMENPRKKLPILITVSIVTIGAVYILITIAQILVHEGISWNVFNPTLLQEAFGVSKSTAESISGGITQAFFALILISVLGVLNGFAASSIKLFAGTVAEQKIVGTTWLLEKARGNEDLAGLYLQLIISIFWSLVYIAVIYGFNSDVYIDGLTNAPTLFFFLIYGLLPLLSAVEKIKLRVKKDRRFWIHITFCIISFLGCWLIVFYQTFYVFIISALKNSNQTVQQALGWGGFADLTPTSPANYESVAYVFIGLGVVFLFLPLLNKLIMAIVKWHSDRGDSDEAIFKVEAHKEFKTNYPKRSFSNPNISKQIRQNLNYGLSSFEEFIHNKRK
ncbi:putative amino acid permease, GabP family [[Mycoplasma] cavipharyngis]|uniref:APC family permease n=1 Tax=[Mycoplasma] cavipharyngis TaxID=92757 RepID=UPI0037040405